MSRILIGWELGAGRGHVISLLAMAGELGSRGHEVALAVQRYDALPERLPGVAFFQAPVWPGLFSDNQPRHHAPAATMIDILARLGLNRARVLKHLITGWESIFAAFRPDLVIGDFAPALIVAAQGRFPTIATGPGFQVPPERDPPPRMTDSEPGFNEAEMLDIVDADLRETGRPPLDHLGALFRCTRPVIASFVELDPYRRANPASFCAPALTGWQPPASQAGGEVFVYVNGPFSNAEPLWRGLHASGLPIRAHVPLIAPDTRRLLEGLRITVEPAPLPWNEISRRSRMLVSHGAHGTMCAALLAGLPHFVFYADLEKGLHGKAMAEAGFGTICNADATTPEALGQLVRQVYDNEAMAEAVRGASSGFQARMTPSFEASIADVVSELLQE